jgi:hypothetical protein
MGVLVPFDKMSGRMTEGRRGDHPEAEGTLNRINLVLQPNPVPYTFAINSVYDGSSRWIYDRIFDRSSTANAYSQVAKLTAADYFPELYDGTSLGYLRSNPYGYIANAPAWVDQLLGIARCPPLEPKDCSKYKQFVRYTDKSGYSVVFVLLMNYRYYAYRPEAVTLTFCLTGDCTNVMNDTSLFGGQYGELAFKGGPAALKLKDGWFLINGVNLYQ